jgi:hypothetical protein
MSEETGKAASKSQSSKRELARMGLPLGTPKKPLGTKGLLKSIFRALKSSGLTGAVRATLVADLEKNIIQAKSLLKPNDFGFKTAKEMAEFFVRTMENTKIKPKTFRAFFSATKIAGYQSRVRGNLFHKYVRNFKPLRKELREAAKSQVEVLNKARKGELLTAVGDEYHGPVAFTEEVQRATSIIIHKKVGAPVEFVDDVWVSYFNKGGQTRWSFLAEVEVKAAGSQKDFGPQIGSAQSRMASSEVNFIEMMIDGRKNSVKVKPEHFIFSRKVINRNAVTLLSNSKWGRLTKQEKIDLAEALRRGDAATIWEASGFRFSSTSKGSGETFLRTTLAINTDELEKFVRAILPSK